VTYFLWTDVLHVHSLMLNALHSPGLDCVYHCHR